MIRFNLQKIIRSKLPLKFDSEGIGYRVQYISGSEYLDHLKIKLKEEIDELIKAENDLDRTIEAGDIIQVIHGFANYYSFELNAEFRNEDKVDLHEITKNFTNSLEGGDKAKMKDCAESLIGKVLSSIRPIGIREVEEKRLSKLEENGGFNEGVFLEYMDLEENDPRVQVFLKNPEKYKPARSAKEVGPFSQAGDRVNDVSDSQVQEDVNQEKENISQELEDTGNRENSDKVESIKENDNRIADTSLETNRVADEKQTDDKPEDSQQVDINKTNDK